MKKALSILLSVALALSLAACGSTPSNDDTTPVEPPVSSAPEETPDASDPAGSTDPTDTPDVSAPAGSTDTPDASEPVEGESSGVLIAYFSRVGNTDFEDGTDTNSTASVVATEDGLQGNTEVLARMIQEAMGGELFLIQTEETYPISYDETIDVGQQEQSAGARPALAAQVENMDHYDTVFLGFPNWWGDMPMALYSFLDEYDLSGKTIVPFVTSGGSGFSSTERTIAELEPDATVLDGLSVGDGRIDGAQEDVTSWLTDLGLIG